MRQKDRPSYRQGLDFNPFESRRIHLIHGIHTDEKDDTVAKLAPYLWETTGIPVVYHRYGYALAITSRFLNPGRAKKIAKDVGPHDILVGHSNGCTLAWMIATEYYKKVHGMAFINPTFTGGAVLINPALDSDKEFPEGMAFVHVYYNEDDGAVPWSKLLWAHPWGDMGQVGYEGSNPIVKNFDCKRVDGMPQVRGHSAIFEDKNLQAWGPFIGQQIQKEV